MFIMETINRYVKDTICTIKTEEQGTQQTRLHLYQSSVDAAEKPGNENIQGVVLRTL